MYIIHALVMVVTVSNGISAGWVTIEDFSPSELVNLTAQEEHKLMLQKLTTKEDKLLASAIYYEMLSHNIGNSFFHIQQETTALRDINAIIRATFGVITKNLLIQRQVFSLLLRTYSTVGAKYARAFKSFSLAFLLVCADLNFSLKNVVGYTTLRDEYKKQTYPAPNKTYHYGIAKSLIDEIQLIEELLNEPKIKHIYAHVAWMMIDKSINFTTVDIKNAVLKLANVPAKFEQVQKIYEESIDEVFPSMRRLDITVTVPDSKSLYFADLQFNMTQTMWRRVKKDIPDWEDYFECETGGNNGPCEKREIGKELPFIKAWPVTSDFNPSELQNLTPQQEHEIFLKKLGSNYFNLVPIHLYLEFQAKSIGNDFFGLIKDEKSNIRNNAIAKATIECFSNLKLQNKSMEAISLGMRSGSEYVAKTGDITQGFTQGCSTIDSELTNEPSYTKKRDEYMKQNLSIPKKTYQYGIGKPTDDQRKVIAELFNDDRTKRTLLHTIWRSARLVKASEKGQTRFAISELAKMPNTSEAAQKIYEQSIEETIPFLKNFTYHEVLRDVGKPTVNMADVSVADQIYYAGLITNRVISKINELPDLVPVFKALRHSFETSKD